MAAPAADLLRETMDRRIVVLDGAMGTMCQALGLTEDDLRGDRFRDHPSSVKGFLDLLNLTRPDAIEDIHLAYFRAGADIVETNTFTATSVAMADYKLEHLAGEINQAGAE